MNYFILFFLLLIICLTLCILYKIYEAKRSCLQLQVNPKIFKRVVKVSTILKYFSSCLKNELREAERCIENDCVKSLEYSQSHNFLRGEVVNDDLKYLAVIYFDDKKGIKQTLCTCFRNDICFHRLIIALAGTYIVDPNPNTKTTETEETYSSHNKSEIEEEDTFARNRLARVNRNTMNGTDVIIKKPETKQSEHELNRLIVTECLKNNPTLACSKQNLTNHFRLSPSKIKELADKTQDQKASSLWTELRKNRLTASSFGAVLKCRTKCPEWLFRRLQGDSNLDFIPAIQHGNRYEGQAKEDFERKTWLVVTKTGLWLHENGFLGASPDGLIGDDSIIEIKCPYKYKDAILRDKLDKNYVVHFDCDGKVVINKNHDYYHQIQGQLYLTKRQYCYLVVWTFVDMLIVIIKRDPDWEKNIQKLEDFYLNEYLNDLLTMYIL